MQRRAGSSVLVHTSYHSPEGEFDGSVLVEEHARLAIESTDAHFQSHTAITLDHPANFEAGNLSSNDTTLHNRSRARPLDEIDEIGEAGRFGCDRWRRLDRCYTSSDNSPLDQLPDLDLGCEHYYTPRVDTRIVLNDQDHFD